MLLICFKCCIAEWMMRHLSQNTQPAGRVLSDLMTKLQLFILQVAFDTCSVLTAEAAEAYGLFWTPLERPATLQLPVTSAAPARPGCFWYKVGGG